MEPYSYTRPCLCTSASEDLQCETGLGQTCDAGKELWDCFQTGQMCQPQTTCHATLANDQSSAEYCAAIRDQVACDTDVACHYQENTDLVHTFACMAIAGHESYSFGCRKLSRSECIAQTFCTWSLQSLQGSRCLGNGDWLGCEPLHEAIPRDKCDFPDNSSCATEASICGWKGYCSCSVDYVGDNCSQPVVEFQVDDACLVLVDADDDQRSRDQDLCRGLVYVASSADQDRCLNRQGCLRWQQARMTVSTLRDCEVADIVVDAMLTIFFWFLVKKWWSGAAHEGKTDAAKKVNDKEGAADIERDKEREGKEEGAGRLAVTTDKKREGKEELAADGKSDQDKASVFTRKSSCITTTISFTVDILLQAGEVTAVEDAGEAVTELRAAGCFHPHGDAFATLVILDDVVGTILSFGLFNFVLACLGGLAFVIHTILEHERSGWRREVLSKLLLVGSSLAAVGELGLGVVNYWSNTKHLVDQLETLEKAALGLSTEEGQMCAVRGTPGTGNGVEETTHIGIPWNPWLLTLPPFLVFVSYVSLFLFIFCRSQNTQVGSDIEDDPSALDEGGRGNSEPPAVEVGKPAMLSVLPELPGQLPAPLHEHGTAMLVIQKDAKRGEKQRNSEASEEGILSIGASDVVHIQNGILMASKRLSQARFEIADAKTFPKLPPGVTPLSRVLRLLPHERRFQEPVMLLLPITGGIGVEAAKLWRSKPSGEWEVTKDVPTKVFKEVSLLRFWLEHFCYAFAGVVKDETSVSPPPRSLWSMRCPWSMRCYCLRRLRGMWPPWPPAEDVECGKWFLDVPPEGLYVEVYSPENTLIAGGPVGQEDFPLISYAQLQQVAAAIAGVEEDTPLLFKDERTHLMVSGRFNDKEMVDYIKAVRDILTQKGVPIFMVDTQGPGDAFGSQTLQGLYTAKALLAFCGTNYGQRTGARYETYVELRYAHDNNLDIIPIQLCHTFPPRPPDLEGRMQNHVVLQRDVMRIMDKDMNESERVADEILEAWTSRLQHLRVYVKPY
ncbi:unnamed protein product [Symbiodinium necroappetens]|uniref:EGF-like domain-containing protein n=1 Tax=Symbiodinium necroappetens TaxID=1628268 RepID=A0A812REF9_9DINO|nr:unnamed protein product [Symbiodinium necroappetens]